MKAFPLVLVASLAACATPYSSSPSTGMPTAGFGQTAIVGPLRVRPISLVEDSRCPANVHCVWAGRLTVLTQIDGAAVATTAPLTLGTPLDLGAISITLIAAVPDQVEGKAIKRGDYRFTFAARAAARPATPRGSRRSPCRECG